MKGETKIMQRSELAKALDNLTHEEKGEVLAILVENNEDIDYVSTTRYITGVYYLNICYNKEHYLVLIKANLQEREAVKSLKTGTERNLAVDNIILNEFSISFFDYNISKLQNRINFYNDEINLARDIYKLQALVQ